MTVRGPSVLPELLAMIGDDHYQCVVQDAEIPEFIDELLKAPVVVQNLAVVTVNGSANEAIGIHSGLLTRGAANDRASGVPRFSSEILIVSIELGGFFRIRKFLFKASGRAVGSMRIGGMCVQKERLVPMLFEPRENQFVDRLGVGAAIVRIGAVALDGGPLSQVVEPAIEPGEAAGERVGDIGRASCRER